MTGSDAKRSAAKRPTVRYLAGAGCARAGDEAAGPALLLVGLAATGSEGAAALLFAAATAGAALGGPVLGAFMDRTARPGALLATALAVYAGGLALAAAEIGRAPLGVVLAVAAGAGTLAPAVSSGWSSQLPRIVAPSALARVSALDAISYSAAALLGPVLAAAVAWGAGPWGAAAAAVALIGAAAPLARGLPPERAGTDGPRPPRRRARPAAELAEGVRTVAGVPGLARATAVSALSMAAGGMLAVCWPLLGAEVLGAPERGTLLAAPAAAAAITATALLARRPGRPAPDTVLWAAGALLCASPLAALAATAPGVPAEASAGLLVLAALVSGAAEGPQLAAVFSIRHRDAPAPVRARVFTIGAGLKIGGLAAGAALAGALAEHGTAAALLAAAGTAALAPAAGAVLAAVHPDRARDCA
ncbi:MFS transporter [Nocardiopsis baichengensis]|uniref:MFS transporter n=1 Tax=Nocardiopsis baichengensis TaxID=280240 RepID=UPI00035EF6EB|nr:MFS transporter [Nocardiopsis baichengensis]